MGMRIKNVKNVKYYRYVMEDAEMLHFVEVKVVLKKKEKQKVL